MLRYCYTWLQCFCECHCIMFTNGGLSILIHGVLLLPDITSCDKKTYIQPSRFTFSRLLYGKCSKILNTFLLFSNKMVIRTRIHKMLVKISNGEDPSQTTSSARPRGYKFWAHSQTQNKAKWLAACQSMHFILNLRLHSSFLTSRPDLGLHCFSWPLWQATNVRNFRTSTLHILFENGIDPGPEVIKRFSCSIPLSTKNQLLIKSKILTN